MKNQKWLHRSVLAAGVAIMLMLAPAAYGQTVGGPTEGTYGGEGGDIVANVDRGAASPTGTADPEKVRSGALPFSGVDLLLLAVGGVTLGVAGAGLARMASASKPSAQN